MPVFCSFLAFFLPLKSICIPPYLYDISVITMFESGLKHVLFVVIEFEGSMQRGFCSWVARFIGIET